VNFSRISYKGDYRVVATTSPSQPGNFRIS